MGSVRNSLLIVILIICFWSNGKAQAFRSYLKFAEVDAALANSEGSLSVAFNAEKGFGKHRKFVIGFGGRFSAYVGRNQYYITAPAKLTSGSTGPGVIFKDNIEANIDSLLVKNAQVNAFNLFLTLGYNFSDRLMVRFNIDVIGFSFGKSTTGNYINGSQGAVESAKPTPFNLLLISDNDKGSLNSEFFVRYLLNERWGVKAGLQFLFTEYTTSSDVQQFPEPNDRFRNKSLMPMIGICRKL